MPATTMPATTHGSTTTYGPTTTYVPDGVDPNSSCFADAVFGDPAESPYVLPYPEGGDYHISQAYCTDGGSHANQLAYDFSIPIGEVIVATRSGEVMEVVEVFPDDGEGASEHNYVMIRHDDGTLAFYAHLQQFGVMVDVGDRVASSQPIALSGNSGQTSDAHLHFGVYLTWPPQEGWDLPVNFRNADGPLDALGGLRRYRRYEALPDPGLPPG